LDIAQDIAGLTLEHPDYGTCEVVRLDGQWLLISYTILHMASGEERQMRRWIDISSVLEALRAKSHTTEYKAA